MKRLAGIITAGVLTLGLSCNASALIIDFTDSIWSGAGGQNSYTTTVGGVQTTLDGYSYSWGSWGDAELTWQDDGLGIDTYGEDDEIGYTEAIMVSFLPDVVVNSISFYDVDGNDTARYSLESGSWIYTGTFSGGAESLFTVETGSTDFISWITVSANRWDDVALAQVDVTAPVPEPSTMLLFGAGALGLFGYTRKRNKKA